MIDIDENIFTRLFDNGTEDYAIVNDDLFAVAKSIRNGTPLPKEATNGDIIKAMFPDADCFDMELVNGFKYITVWFADARISHIFDVDWWNTPYKVDKEG